MDLEKPVKYEEIRPGKAPGKLRGFKFNDAEFSNESLERLMDHPIYGETVRKFLSDGRRDFRHLKAHLQQLKERARRQKNWLQSYESTGNERAACKMELVSYATFYDGKNNDPKFRTAYLGLREFHAMNLIDIARENAKEPDATVDRWNLIKTEVPEYNPKKEQAVVNLNLKGDIEFVPQSQFVDVQPLDAGSETEEKPHGTA